MQAATWAPQIQVRIPPELNGAAALHGSWLFFWQLESPGGEFTGDLSVNLSVCPFTHPSIHTCIYPTKPEGKNIFIYGMILIHCTWSANNDAQETNAQ